MFFRFKDRDNQDREMLVFLTPRIVGSTTPSLAAKAKIIRREQADASKKESITVALDKLSE